MKNKFVGLFKYTPSCKVLKGCFVEEWKAGSNCPACGRMGNWRQGVNFDHEMRCFHGCTPAPVWEPEKRYFLLREKKKIYTASKIHHAPKWLELRDQGHNINSTWIDDEGQGKALDFADLAQRCISEASAADFLLLYCESGEVLKGALMEVGAALAAGKEVRFVGDCDSISNVFRKHTLWRDFDSIEGALSAA